MQMANHAKYTLFLPRSLQDFAKNQSPIQPNLALVHIATASVKQMVPSHMDGKERIWNRFQLGGSASFAPWQIRNQRPIAWRAKQIKLAM
jgi:hypothetical protein